MFHYGFAQCHDCPKTQHPDSGQSMDFTGHRLLVCKFYSLALTRVLTWFLFWTGISSPGVTGSPPTGAFSRFSAQCPTLPLALEPQRISGSSSFKVQWEEDSGTFWLISAGNQVLWAFKAPLRRHQDDIYSGSSWDLRQDLQEMIAGSHVVRLKL